MQVCAYVRLYVCMCERACACFDCVAPPTPLTTGPNVAPQIHAQPPTGWLCDSRACDRSGFTEGIDWAYFDRSNGDCEACKSRCVRDLRCTAIECGAVGYCSAWFHGACSVSMTNRMARPKGMATSVAPSHAVLLNQNQLAMRLATLKEVWRITEELNGFLSIQGPLFCTPPVDWPPLKSWGRHSHGGGAGSCTASSSCSNYRYTCSVCRSGCCSCACAGGGGACFYLML